MRYDGGELERGERCAVGAGDGAGAARRSSRACENYDWTPAMAAGAVNVKPGGMGTLPYLTLPVTLPIFTLHVHVHAHVHAHVHVTCYMLYDVHVELESALA